MNKEMLERLSVKQLDELCKERNLQRYNHKKHLTKSELINNLLGTEEQVLPVEDTKEEKKKNYVRNAGAGTLIVFVDRKGYTRSGKVAVNNSAKETLEVEIKSGRKFYIRYDEVLWVTSEDNHRFPKDILILLKESQKAIEEDFKKKISVTNNDVEFLKKRMNGIRS